MNSSEQPLNIEDLEGTRLVLRAKCAELQEAIDVEKLRRQLGVSTTLYALDGITVEL